MDKVTLKLNVRDTNNNDKTVNISNVNPDVSDSTLKLFGQKLNSLTTNTLVSTEKVVTSDITDAVATGVTFSMALPLFAENPDFIKQGTDWTFAELSRLTASRDVWVNSAVTSDSSVVMAGNYLSSNKVNSATATSTATYNVFNFSVNGVNVTYNLGQWINFDSETLIADLNSKLTDTTVAYSNGTLTFTNPDMINISINTDSQYIINKQFRKLIGQTYYGTALPDGVTITQSMGNYTVEVNLTDTGIYSLTTDVIVSPSFNILDGEYSADVQSKINLVNSSIMPLFNQILSGNSSVTVDNIDSSVIATLAYYGSKTKIQSTSTWIVYPVQFTSGSGEVKFGAGDFGIETENWSNYSWAFIVKFTDSATCYSNLAPQSSTNSMNRLIVDNVGNSTALIYLVPKAG